MSKLKKIVEDLKASGKLYDGFILTEEERNALKKKFDAQDDVKISKKERISRFSTIKAENGELFAIYNPSIDDPSKKEPIDQGSRSVIKVGQNLETGDWVVIKLQKSKPKSHFSIEKMPKEEAQAEKKFLAKYKRLKGYQERIKYKDQKNETVYHYIIQDIVPGIQLRDPSQEWSRKPKTGFLDIYKDLTEVESLTLYLNILKKLQQLKEDHIIHRDLHGGNLLVDRDDNFAVHIIDWGSAVEANNEGFWDGFHYTDPEGKRFGKFQFANGKDICDIMEDLKGISNQNFRKIFEDQFDEIIPLCKKHRYIDPSDYNDVDLRPYIEKVEQLIAEAGQKSRPKF